MSGVPHLNELNNKYRERGFEIVAVSSEAAGTIEEKMVKGAKATFGVVKAEIASLYQTRGIPHGWVLDAEGKCIWEGHPGQLNDAQIEEWIKDLAPGKITKEVSKQLKPAVEAYNKGQFGKAFEAVAERFGHEKAGFQGVTQSGKIHFKTGEMDNSPFLLKLTAKGYRDRFVVSAFLGGCYRSGNGNAGGSIEMTGQ